MKKISSDSCRFLLQLIILMLIGAGGFAQTTLSGKVTNSKDGTPVPGVTITAKGTKTSVQSDANGSFQINVPAGTTILQFTSTGFTPQEISISGRTSFTVNMIQNNQQLNEVVVVGYGSIRKKDVTGSVITVGEKDFQKGTISTPEQMIAGKVAGVSVISNGGQPGSGSTIRIRGGSSLAASNDPLIVIDGVPLDNNGVSGAGNALSFVNSNDIESFTILKDASAAAIYGTRASNGVILITTKKGLGGKLRVSFSSVNSIAKNINNVDVLSADQIRSVVNANGSAAQKAMLGNANTNWQDEIYRPAFGTDNNISISGGIKKLPYRVSIGYQNQDGVLMRDNFQKASLAVVLNPTFFDNHLKVDINLKGSMETTHFGPTGAIGAAISFDPTQPIYNTNKSNRFMGYYEWLDPNSLTGLNALAGKNPVGILNAGDNIGKPSRSIGNIKFDYKVHFLPDLHVNVNVGYDVATGKGTTYQSDSAASSYVAGGKGGSRSQYRQEQRNSYFDSYLNYVKEIKSIKTRMDLTAGYSYNDFLNTYYNFPAYFASGAQNGNLPGVPFDKPEHTLVSFFGRGVFSIYDRFTLTGTIRRDASSRFGPSHKWGSFPSAAFAWKLKDESFLKSSKTVSDLKLRIGYGVTGQQDGIGNFEYLARYSLSNPGATYQFGNTYYQGYRPSGYNPEVKWEETHTTNLALDYGFLNNRITGSIDFYYRKTIDLLTSVPAPAGTNFSAYILSNVGNLENRGVEFSINAEPIRKKDLTWDLGFNIAYNKNKILKLTVLKDDPNYIGFPTENINGVQGFAFLNSVGTPRNTFYLYKQVYDAAGKPIEGLVEDLNRDGIINENDKYKSKAADPNVFLGFSTQVSYKKWNFGTTLRASFNNYVYNNVFSNNGRLNQITGNSVIGNASSNYLETGFKGNSDLEMLSDYWLENASFLRMDNANVGYNFGKIRGNKANLRANLNVQNVFVITKYKGLDPEIGNGVDKTIYPRPRIVSLSLNLDF
ncbi:MAG: TonB-dependent receptor [Ferruginibacter sp.]